MADQVLYSGVACITDLMVKEGLINLDFADVRAVMREMGKAMMGTGEAAGEKRALTAAEAAIANPLIDDASMKGAKGLLISITGGRDLTLYEVDEAATRIREEVDQDANIIVGATFDEGLEGIIRVSVVATGIDQRLRAAAAGRRRRNRASPRSRSGCAPTRAAGASPSGSSGSGRRPSLPRPRQPPTPASSTRRSNRPRPRSPRRSCRRDRRRGDHPADRAQAVAVHRAGLAKAPEQHEPEGLHSAAAGAHAAARARACRGSTNCRCRRRTKSAPGAASCRRRTIRKSGACRCCSGWRRSVSAAAKQDEDAAAAPGAPAARGCAQPTANGCPDGRCRREIAPRAGLRIRQAPGAAGTRPARPAGACA